MSNQTDFQDDLTAGIIDLESYFGTLFEWSAEQYPCLVTPFSKSERFEEGGFQSDVRSILTVRKKDEQGRELFPDGLPAIGDSVKVDGVRYRILETETDPIDPTFRITLGDADK